MWSCDCGVKWQTCITHRHCTKPDCCTRKKSKAKGQPVSANKPFRRRKKGSCDTYEEMLAEDLKLEEEKLKAMSLDKASSIIDLGKRPMTDELRVNFLGPKLKRRFVGDSAPINSS